MSQLTNLIATNCALLRQGQDAIALDGGALYQIDPGLAGGQIGAHFRHVLEHYVGFFSGYPAGRIDYDARARDVALETDPVVARATAQRIIEQLMGLVQASMARPLEVNVAVATADHGRPQWTRSTLARELSFLLSHTVHHYALIALQARQRGIELGEDFGVAPATLEYRSGMMSASH